MDSGLERDISGDGLGELEEIGKRVGGVRLKTLFYDLRKVVLRFFYGEQGKPKSPALFADKAENLVEKTWNAMPPRELLSLQRQTDDTKARRRLEKWVKWVIAAYLVLVLALAVFSRVYADFISPRNEPLLSDTALITLFSTTTVNIIGLGFIVLRGHFPQDTKPKRPDYRKQRKHKTTR